MATAKMQYVKPLFATSRLGLNKYTLRLVSTNGMYCVGRKCEFIAAHHIFNVAALATKPLMIRLGPLVRSGVSRRQNARRKASTQTCCRQQSSSTWLLTRNVRVAKPRRLPLTVWPPRI